LVAAAAYMARMERLYAVDSAVAVDDGNDDGGGRGVEAGAPVGDGIARVNGQATAMAAAVEEEEEEGAADRDGECVTDGDGGPVAHKDRKDGNGSAAPRSRRMTTTTASTAVGGGAAAIVRRVLSAAVVVIVVVVVIACGAVWGWEVAITTTTATTTTATATILNAGPHGAPPRRHHPRNRPYKVSSGLGARPPGSAVVVPCTVITNSDSIWENGPHFTTTDIKTVLPPFTPTPHRCCPHWAPSSPSSPARLSPSPTPARSGTPASPPKPLDNLLHLPPKAAPVQKAINLVEDKPLKAAVCWSNSGRLSVFVWWLSRCPGVATRRVMPLRSCAFSDLRFSPPERHPGTIRGKEDRNSWSANECVCIAGSRVGYKRAHHVPPHLRSAPAAPAPPPGEGRRAPSVVGGGGKAMDYRQEARKCLSAVHLALHE
jgi:hypothetical protein